jgi:cellobiose phosphorylase
VPLAELLYSDPPCADLKSPHYYAEVAEKMTAAILAHGWDGAWFRRAYDVAGNPVGSQACTAGQIFSDVQGICVMAGVGLENGYAAQALDSAQKHLSTPHGLLLHQPAYAQYDPHLGDITAYPPGYQENAGILCHTNPWIMIAATRLGRGDQAHADYLGINPSARAAMSEIHRCEPYVYAQMIAGRAAPTHGEARNSWLTGAAAWNYVAITQYILGIRPALQGLRLEPVFPSTWSGFKATRRFRGVTYQITVERAGPGNQTAIRVNGQPIEGNVVPLPPAGTTEMTILVTVS